MARLWWVVAILVCGVIALPFVTPTTSAQGPGGPQLVNSVPKMGDKVDTLPTMITLTFDRPVISGLVDLFQAPNDTPVKLQDPQVSEAKVGVAFPSGLKAGKYRLAYVAVDAKRQRSEGSLIFEVTKDAVKPPQNTTTTAPTTTATTPENTETTNPTEPGLPTDDTTATPVPTVTAPVNTSAPTTETSNQGGSNVIWVVAGLLLLGLALLLVLNMQSKNKTPGRRQTEQVDPDHL